MTRSPIWAKFANDFNAMSDAQIKSESDMFRDQLDEAEEWLEAVEAWKAAGSPRGKNSETRLLT